MAQYGTASYWDERYKRDTEFFDWYQRWVGLQGALQDYLRPSDRLLIVGCGRSRLSEELYDAGYKNQMNIDVSRVAIDAMQEIYKNRTSMEFRVMNAMSMEEFPSESFDCAIDKGTLDSILCGDNSTQNATAMLKEISRILKPKGHYICITYGQPSFRMPYLDKPELLWTIDVKSTHKPTLATEVALATQEHESVHYIYICTKQPDDGQKEQHP